MTNVAVFAVGLLVTLMVAAAMALLVWGAIIDGREDEERREADALGRPDEVTRIGVVGAQ